MNPVTLETPTCSNTKQGNEHADAEENRDNRLPQSLSLDPATTDVIDAKAAYLGMVADAKNATAAEHELTLWKGIKSWRRAIFWSWVFSLCIVMDGYDLGFTGTLYAHPAFQAQFGERYKGGHQIPARWQTGFHITGKIGNIIGVFLDGYFSEAFGRRLVSLLALSLLACTIFMQFFATSLPMFLVGRMIAGIPIGVFQAAANTYAAEVCPTVLRAYLTTYVCLCWVIGQFICAGVTYQLSKMHNEWGWRIIVAVQWAWIPPLLVLIFLAPESPWWLVRTGRFDEAERVVKRLADGVNPKEQVAMMIYTTQLEMENDTGESYWDCFKGTDLRRTEIACMVYGIQAGVGNPLQSYTTYFFQQAGLPVEDSFKLNVGNSAASFVGTLLAWPLLYCFGRRQVFFGGLCLMTLLYFAIGIAGIPPIANSAANWSKSSLLIVYLFAYCPTVGATVYAIVGEVGATRLRSKTVALARNFYSLISILVGIVVPYMLNPSAWGWGAKIGFFFGGIGLLLLVWVFFRLPEMKNRTYEELDILFSRKVSARNFKSSKINIYEDYKIPKLPTARKFNSFSKSGKHESL